MSTKTVGDRNWTPKIIRRNDLVVWCTALGWTPYEGSIIARLDGTNEVLAISRSEAYGVVGIKRGSRVLVVFRQAECRMYKLKDLGIAAVARLPMPLDAIRDANFRVLRLSEVLEGILSSSSAARE